MIDVLERINQLKNERGWTTYRLAEESTLSQSALTNMFARKTLPSLTSLNLICEAFGITLSEFFSETSSMADDNNVLAVYKKLSATNKKMLISIAKILKDNQ